MRQTLNSSSSRSETPEAAPPRGVDARPIRILQVEDDDVDAMIVGHFLHAIASPPLVVDRVRSAEEALERIEAQRYDLCLLDYWLGAQSSLHVVARIDASRHRLPIVVLSGVVDAAAREFALMAGAAACLPKNELTANGLARAIETGLAQRGGAPAG